MGIYNLQDSSQYDDFLQPWRLSYHNAHNFYGGLEEKRERERERERDDFNERLRLYYIK